MVSMYTLNTLLIIVIILVTAIFLYFKLTDKKSVVAKKELDTTKFTLPKLRDYALETLYDFTSSNLNDLNLTDEEYVRMKSKRVELKRAIKGSSHGDLNDKTYLKTFLFDLLYKTIGFTDETINNAIPFDDRKKLSHQDKFEILLYQYKKKYGFNALSKMIEKHDLDALKYVIEDGQTPSYIITKEEIEQIFKAEYKQLNFEDKLHIIVQRIYQENFGFGVVDEIRDMNIDGVSGGVSGLTSSITHLVGEYDHYVQQMKIDDASYAHDSIWIFFKGKSIHLECISFGTEHELKRVCQTIYKYNNPSPLTEDNGAVVNEMKDGSRIVVLRPNFAETWGFFVRKFDVPNATLEQLVKDENAELPIGMIKFLMKGCRITAVTGAQGSGKTTKIMAMVKHIAAWHPIRVVEMAFELHLRKIFPGRNIFSLRETDKKSGQDALDITKKMDGSVGILGEVATDPVAAWMVQMGQVANLFYIFSHHAKTFPDLILSLRNSLLKTGVFSDEQTAEEQVVKVINFDVHLKRDFDGKRYIERITECVPKIQEPYPDEYREVEGIEQKLEKFMDTTREYYKRVTDRELYEARNIIEFRDGKYVASSKISDKNMMEMLEHMSPEDSVAFRSFLEEHWGVSQ
ncbi:Flp pilus assembly complex ATPase component TadA [Paenibacillus sp. Y412MC10]|uniref:Flp pilus assembly complex ATPase component TadA n=1 Tax=Geobacillus sp. (strain Y412MC10) TaxID=481743 RepID=UPI0011AB5E31|nr:Flp pilus assembly complex ATPase component TadA [Paenibacillus sp. Y412MC10]